MIEKGLNQDFLEMLESLASMGAEFVVVGAHALAVHGVPRATGDLDIFVRPCPENAERVFRALKSFGAPVVEHGVRQEDFETAGSVYQIGIPPRRIDLLTRISGLTFEEAWASRVELEILGFQVGFIGREALIVNKRAAGREKDLVDVRTLGAKTG